ncbi:LysR family transcriptional regulator, partial [Escherichia coli]
MFTIPAQSSAMDVRRLRLLLELSRLGSMREVADELATTTSSVSQGIAALARDVGTPLVEPV